MMTPYDIANAFGQWQRSAIDESTAAMGRVVNFYSLWERARTVQKGMSPSEVVYEEDRLKLLHYLSDEPPR